MRRPPTSPLFPSTTLFRSQSPPRRRADRAGDARVRVLRRARLHDPRRSEEHTSELTHGYISYPLPFFKGCGAHRHLPSFPPRRSSDLSRHRDGELIARAMRAFGFSAVRGSTTRGGSSALRVLVAEGRRGRGLAGTPDGPKGPRGVVQPGVIQLARLTGLPVFPLAFGASKKKSWTRGMAFSSRIPSPAACCAGVIPSGCR